MLVSLKGVGQEQKGVGISAYDDADEPEYPYALRIYLDDAILKALGITDVLDAGAVLTLNALVEVHSSEVEDVKAGSGTKTTHEVCLQITDAELVEHSDDNERQTKALYGGTG